MVYGLIGALTVVALFFGSLIAYFYLHGGLEPGPLATWVSGLASTAAVMTALWGQHRAQRLRVEDHARLDANNAHQVSIKLREIVNILGAFHEAIAVEPVNEIVIEDGGPQEVMMVGTISGFAEVHRPTLLPSEELLFARAGKLDALYAVRHMNAMVGVMQTIVSQYNTSAAELYGKTVVNGSDIADRKLWIFDRKDKKLARTICVLSGEVGVMREWAVDALAEAIKEAPDAHRIVMTYLPEEERFALDVSRSVAVFELGMPEWSPPPSAEIERHRALLQAVKMAARRSLGGLLVSTLADFIRKR